MTWFWTSKFVSCVRRVVGRFDGWLWTKQTEALAARRMSGRSTSDSSIHGIVLSKSLLHESVLRKLKKHNRI
jgi:hypothetical protein